MYTYQRRIDDSYARVLLLSPPIKLDRSPLHSGANQISDTLLDHYEAMQGIAKHFGTAYSLFIKRNDVEGKWMQSSSVSVVDKNTLQVVYQIEFSYHMDDPDLQLGPLFDQVAKQYL